MNKIAMISLSAVGSTALFAVSFIGFAKLNGVPLHSLPVIGGMFPAEEQEPSHGQDSTPLPAPPVDEHAPEPAHETNNHGTQPVAKPLEPTTVARTEPARAGIFDLLDADSLYSKDELKSLADSLRVKNREVDLRATELDRREDLLTDRLAALDERRRTMDEFAARLDARERELKAREAEAGRDAKTGAAAEGSSLPAADLSEFFNDGETEVLVQRLAGFSPLEMARILIKLPPTRAKELLDALPSARWRECAEAYARAAQTPP